MPPTKAFGNIADKSAGKIRKFIQADYNDGVNVSASVGKFSIHRNGLNDFGTNVSEWMNDWYQSDWYLVFNNASERNKQWGAEPDEFHIIRGSSWAKGYLPQLRWAYIHRGTTGLNDVGFRVARTVKVPDFQ